MANDNAYLTTAGVIPKVRRAYISGGAAGDHTLTGLSDRDKLLRVDHLPAATVAGSVGTTSAVTAGEDTAGTKDIDTGLGATLGAYVVQVRTAAGANVALADAAISEAAGVVTIADGAATFVLAATDIVTVIATPATSSATQGAPADLTSEFTISADDTLNNAAGTATTGGLLVVTYYDDDWGDSAAIP